MRLAGIPAKTLTPFLLEVWPKRWPQGLRYLPSLEATYVLSAVLFALGVLSVWRRARSVEVVG
jgi:hypothetical protein